MAGAGVRRETLAIVALVVVVVFGAGFTYVVATDEPAEPTFCILAVPMIQRGELTAVVQDRGDPGLGSCDGEGTHPTDHVLGIDCAIRAPDGTVVAEVEPNRADGTCGESQDGSPFPASWSNP